LGEYGFPQSHAMSFALRCYDSAWLKCYEPAVFTCALLNSQPMGSMAGAAGADGARPRVEVRAWMLRERMGFDARAARSGEPALRLGMRL